MQSRDLSAHTPYRAGEGIEEVARELGVDPDSLIKLSSNENPLGPSPAAVEAVHEAVEEIHTYPKTAHTDLMAAVAAEWNLEPRQVWLSPGGDGFLDYLGRAMLDPGDRVLVPDPAFAYYQMSARYHGGEVDRYSLDRETNFTQTPETLLSEYDGHRIVYVTSPHNPTGSEMSLADIERVAAATDDETVVLVDEAYGDFTATPSARQLFDERDDICVLRTFSKSHGLAGLRVGYGLVPDTWADAYDRINTPFAVNKLACRAGLAALEDHEHLDRTVETARWAREYMHEHLDAPTWESGGNFVLAAVGDGEAVAAATQRKGVIIRDCSSFGLSDCVRVTCGTRETTPLAVERINEVLAG
ncbi:MAG: histidinol phosphate aminotransferase apoenzyme [halophilic archaeon J07HX64]|jgi:histidinol phosphate aminotransferase apoenzyme (EC 2.6.1.9)|nr:MAG: histidinol phosphate aminotransferase apoenzyme [halophilic archaeon J07HX64]